jgi:phage tail tape-measure protein
MSEGHEGVAKAFERSYDRRPRGKGATTMTKFTRLLLSVPLLLVFAASTLSGALADSKKSTSGGQSKGATNTAGKSSGGSKGGGQSGSPVDAVNNVVGGTVGGAVGGAVGGLLGAFGPK